MKYYKFQSCNFKKFYLEYIGILSVLLNAILHPLSTYILQVFLALITAGDDTLKESVPQMPLWTFLVSKAAIYNYVLLR